MNDEIKGLGEMTDEELWGLFTAIGEAIVASGDPRDLWTMHGAVNEELSRRGL